uniref:hypothetical protein n=1 Tax=uncultured Sphingomonas sp. TaxID=158754 RepID=UPI0035CBE302
MLHRVAHRCERGARRLRDRRQTASRRQRARLRSVVERPDACLPKLTAFWRQIGAFDKSGTPIADRVRYTATVRLDAEMHGIPWAYWQFDGDFIVYDIDHDRWVEPIRQALVGAP